MDVETAAPRSDVRARSARRDAGRWDPVVLGLLAAALRMPFLAAPMSTDEAGFLIVARHWHEGGDSLYGRYWVDRPPLLLELFRLADLVDGLTALRVLGCVAVVVTVCGVGAAARRLGGRRAGLAAAGVAGGLLTSPLLGGLAVNGELLAAPFVAGGVWAAVVAMAAEGPRARTGAALCVGGAGVAAILIKQNMIDVAVFALVLVAVAARRRLVDPDRLPTLAFGSLIGAVGVGGLVFASAMARGSSPGEIFQAMYPFRLQAAAVLADYSWSARAERLAWLGLKELASLGPVILIALLVLLVRKRLPHTHALAEPATMATLALGGYGLVSVLAGGGFWAHYLIQLVVPTSLAAGLLVATGARWVRLLLAATIAGSLVCWAVGLFSSMAADGQVIGRAVGEVARPDDTIVSILGSGDIVEASGLTSPFSYLWSLPSRARDPEMHELRELLGSESAPTWVVIRGWGTHQELDRRGVGAELDQHYREVGTVCGRTIHLRDGIRRPIPDGPDSSEACRLPLSPLASADS